MENNSAPEGRRVVVTGLGVVSSIGVGKKTFYDALAAGESGIHEITAFDASSFPVKIAAEVRHFDINRSAEDSEDVRGIFDRKVHFGLAAFDEAYASSGVSSDALSDARTALNLGVSLESFSIDQIASSVRDHRMDFARLYAEAMRAGASPMQTPLDTTNRILVRRYGITGMNFVNSSACAASAQAIGHSFRMMRRGEIDLAFCGGMDSMINPLGVGGFSLLGALSTSNDLLGVAMRPFDARRNGTVLGEGAAVLVLETLERALARNAYIHAEVIGFGSSCDAYKPTDPDPEGLGAVQAMNSALHSAGLTSDAIEYINAHGTSTPKNDEIETKAIKTVFGSRAARIPVSSTKSMIGHCIAASGAIECVASISAFERNVIPPTINYVHKDHYCDLDYVPNTARVWTGDRILTNSFGFGGQNASLILQRWRSH
ncbi:MAG TPA: beta-ketoacyl-[acyl-carrier-protein] synthase family protein [Bacteroidota bacterium]|nr:beta-ketoacyl-[acyl-carrier-protein] synthase family protein [Bacteroidota bacterium]